MFQDPMFKQEGSPDTDPILTMVRERIDVTVLDHHDEVLPMYYWRNELWVAGEPGQAYKMAIKNKFKNPLEVVLSINGMTPNGDAASIKSPGYIIQPSITLPVLGKFGDPLSMANNNPKMGVFGVAIYSLRPTQASQSGGFVHVSPSSDPSKQTFGDLPGQGVQPVGPTPQRAMDYPFDKLRIFYRPRAWMEMMGIIPLNLPSPFVEEI